MMQLKNLRLVLLLTLLMAGLISGQDAYFNVIGIEGSARMQRSSERSWKKLGHGSKLSDNDLIETFFQTKLVMQFGVNNIIILGSNSKALLNISVDEKEGKEITEISVTLFSGGLFTKAISQCKVTIYTANAVGVMDSGSVTTVADSKSGETGFQVLGGLIFVRNIAQQKGIELRSGLTTMIQPAKEPTAPLYITHRHVGVLKHFFGDEYITSELDASGIKPTDERGTKRGGGATDLFSTRSHGYVDEGMNKSLFSLSRIYGSILTDREKQWQFYRSIGYPQSFIEGKGRVYAGGDLGVSAQGMSLRLRPSFSYVLGNIDLGVRASLAQTADGVLSPGFSSLSSMLDKIHHISFGNSGSRFALYAGQIENLTLGYGLMVDHFSTNAYTNAFSPLAVAGHYTISDEMKIQAFTANCVIPYINGVYFQYTPSTYHFGTGYVGDLNQYTDIISGVERRFVSYEDVDTVYPNIHRNESSIHCYLFDFAADIISRYNLDLKVTVEFAKNFSSNNNGFVVRMPGFVCNIKNICFGGGVTIEGGKLLSSQFNQLYLDRRYVIKSDLRSNFLDSIMTPNSRLSKKRSTMGLSLFYCMNPYRGVDVNVWYKQDLTPDNTVEYYKIDTTITADVSFDYSYRLRVAINNSLFRYVQIAELIVQEYHGRLCPVEGMPFSSWMFNARLSAVTIPFFFNLAFETGIDFFYFDTGKKKNYQVDSEDLTITARAGVHWGF